MESMQSSFRVQSEGPFKRPFTPDEEIARLEDRIKGLVKTNNQLREQQRQHPAAQLQSSYKARDQLQSDNDKLNRRIAALAEQNLRLEEAKKAIEIVMARRESGVMWHEDNLRLRQENGRLQEENKKLWAEIQHLQKEVSAPPARTVHRPVEKPSAEWGGHHASNRTELVIDDEEEATESQHKRKRRRQGDPALPVYEEVLAAGTVQPSAELGQRSCCHHHALPQQQPGHWPLAHGSSYVPRNIPPFYP